MDTITEEQLTLFAVDSPAKTYQPQARESDLMAKDPVYTGKCCELLASVCPDTQFLKTSQDSFLETKEDGLQSFSMTWPRSGLMRNGTVSQLPTLGRTTTEIGSGLLPTPVCSDQYAASSPQNLLAKGRNPMTNQLRDAVRYMDEKSSMVGLTEKVCYRWPTPAAHEARLGWQNRASGKKGTQESLSTLVMKSEGREGSQEWKGGQLNPNWVDWLMGFPIGHTDLNN